LVYRTIDNIEKYSAEGHGDFKFYASPQKRGTRNQKRKNAVTIGMPVPKKKEALGGLPQHLRPNRRIMGGTVFHSASLNLWLVRLY